VTLTRCPTCFERLSLFAASMTSIGAMPLFRKPFFQLRDFGASVPLVSFRRNVSSSRSRHPVIVTGVASGATGLDADSTEDAFGAAAVSASAGLVIGMALTLVTGMALEAVIVAFVCGRAAGAFFAVGFAASCDGAA
jgi:hypothetical protein